MSKQVEDAAAASALIACGLRPKQLPTRDVVYADLVRRYRVAGARQVRRERSLEELLEDSSAALAHLVALPQDSQSDHAQRQELSVVLADVLLRELDMSHFVNLDSGTRAFWDDLV